MSTNCVRTAGAGLYRDHYIRDTQDCLMIFEKSRAISFFTSKQFGNQQHHAMTRPCESKQCWYIFREDFGIGSCRERDTHINLFKTCGRDGQNILKYHIQHSVHLGSLETEADFSFEMLLKYFTWCCLKIDFTNSTIKKSLDRPVRDN